MKLSDILRILRRNILLLIIFPSMLAALVYYKTKNEKKEYSSSFMIYTGIASGFNLTTEENPRLDHNAVNNAFDNFLTTVKARETYEEVGIRLLATHLRLEKPDDRIVSAENFYRVRQLMPDTMEKRIRDAADLEEAVKVIYDYKSASGNNAVKAMLNSGYEVYGVNTISSKIVAKRKDQSDMLEVSYTANDPAICQQTLQILSEVFIRRYKDLKSGEIKNVVTYFNEHTKESYNKLKAAEDKLKNFEVRNKIINYEEQTRNISSAKQNLIEAIEEQRMLKSAAEASVRNLETRLQLRKGIMETNEKILAKRQELAELNYKIANSQMYKDKPVELAKVKGEAEQVKEEIRQIIAELYKMTTSTEGLPANDLMTQWLENTLVLDESSARLKIMEAELKNFDKVYDEYAPLGATLSRLKREIEVAEKEYMEQLSAYNMNKQRQQNIELASNVKIVDSPYFPLQPKASKRMVMVMGSFVAGFVLIFGALLAFQFFDNKVRTPARAEELTGLKLVGALPLMKKRERTFDMEYLESSLMEQAISAIILEIKHRGGNNNSTKFIMVSSAKSEEGKTWCAYKLANKLSEIKGRVLFMYPESVSQKVSGMSELRLGDAPLLDLKEYHTSNDLINKENPQDLAPDQKIKFEDYSFVLIEIPPLSENQLPVELVKKVDVSLLVLRADRVWSETDNYVSRLYRKACSCEPLLILNRVSADGVREIFGDLPEKRRKKNQAAKQEKTIAKKELAV